MLRLYVGDDDPTTSVESNCKPEVALLITTYQKPRHLGLVLNSIEMLKGVEGKIEVVVVDDGSTDETFDVVERFAQSVDFPVRMTTHRHRAFQVARCRNEGVMASTAPYMIFLDGDCLVRPDFVLQHFRLRRPRQVLNGDYFRLDENVSAEIDEDVVRRGAYLNMASAAEHERIERDHRKARWYELIRHRRKPKLIGNNVGVWRDDFELVNGFDEDFEGWGTEDDDIGYRFRQAGIRIKSIRRWTPTYHVWHPRDPSWAANWLSTPNAFRLLREHRETRCRNGLLKLGQLEVAALAARHRNPADRTRMIDFASTQPILSIARPELAAA